MKIICIGLSHHTAPVEIRERLTYLPEALKAAFDRGLMLLTCGTYDNVVRWIPALVVTKEQIDEALKIFAASLDTVTK